MKNNKKYKKLEKVEKQKIQRVQKKSAEIYEKGACNLQIWKKMTQRQRALSLMGYSKYVSFPCHLRSIRFILIQVFKEFISKPEMGACP